MWTNRKILEIAMAQSAADTNASPEDFRKTQPVFVPCALSPEAKSYYAEPLACLLVSYGSNIVASVKEAYRPTVEEYLGRFTWYHCFETPNLHWLDDRLREKGQRVCMMGEYFLPDLNRLRKLHCRYPMKLFTAADFAPLYLPQWGNALCEDRKHLDVLGVGAYDGDQLIALAGCSADGRDMWQIGVDVLPSYRRQGIASALTSRLALEILDRNKVPFYSCAWSNIASAGNAFRCGFMPAWAEMTVKPVQTVEEMNRG